MADSSPLRGLLYRAGKVFTLAGELGRAFQHAMHVGGVTSADSEALKVRKFAELCDSVLDLRDTASQPPEGFADVAAQLREAGRICKAIRSLSPNDFTDRFEFYPELNSVAVNGHRAVKAVTKALDRSDPFAFVDEPRASTTSDNRPLPTRIWTVEDYYRVKDFYDARGLKFNPALEYGSPAAYHVVVQAQYDAMEGVANSDEPPASPIAFLESVRDEVHNAADAKRLQVAKGYSNDTLASMVGGIKWAEARERVAEFSDLPAEVVEQVASVLRRELTGGTVEQIDDLLTPAVRALRDAWEEFLAGGPKPVQTVRPDPQPKSTDTPTPAKRTKRSTEKGEGRTKIIAALNTHHQYDNGSCGNWEYIGNNKLAGLAEVSISTASAFFKDEFKGHHAYMVLCRDPGRLAAHIKHLNGEYAAHELFGRRPRNEDDRDDD